MADSFNKPLTPEQETVLLSISLRMKGPGFPLPDHSLGFLRAERRRLIKERGLSAVVNPISQAMLRRGGLVDHEDDEPGEGYRVKGVSTMYGPNGEITARWVKTTEDADRIAQLIAAIPALVAPIAEVVAPSGADEEGGLLTVYPLGDPHLGMAAWAQASGVDFDLDIAERNLVAAVDKLVGLSPASSRALICNVGDLFHFDSKRGATTKGTSVDTAGTWARTLHVGIRTMKRLIERALAKHAEVTVVNALGNHDEHTSQVLSAILAEAYSLNDRVTVQSQPRGHHYIQHGRCLIGVTHGKGKPNELGQIMAADEPQAWGATEHRYWYIGHVHHDTVKEVPGCKIESFRTLAPHDSWHRSSGFRSGRDMKAIVLHETHGEILRHTVGVGML